MNFSDLTAAPTTDPLPLYRYRDGLYTVDLLTAALTELDLFSHLAEHPKSREEICRELHLEARPADVMLTLFVAMGLLERKAATYSVTALTREHLVKDSPFFLGPYYAALKARPVCQDYIKVLRTGRPANWGSFKHEKEWAKAMEDERFAREFTAAMDSRGMYLGQALAKALDLQGHRCLLDIAGGSGIYACSIVARHSHLRAAILEKEPVDVVARRLINERGYSDRVAVCTGDMFQGALPDGYDVHLFSNVLHDWDVPVVEQLLARSEAALPNGGMIVIHDMHLDRDKSGPLPVAAYSALLMNITEGRCYSAAEIESYLHDAGFVDVSFAPTAADRSRITAIKRTEV